MAIVVKSTSLIPAALDRPSRVESLMAYSERPRSRSNATIANAYDELNTVHATIGAVHPRKRRRAWRDGHPTEHPILSA
jgi:hypothetical protein